LPLLVLLAACASSGRGLRVAGSTSVQPLAEILAEAYTRSGGGRVSIQGGGSTAGVQAVLHGVAGLGAVSRRLAPEESAQGLVAHTIGYDLLTVVVHPTNPLAAISRARLGRLFSGVAADWRDVGGPPGPVYLVSREAGSGSREAFRSLVGPVSPRALIQSSAGAIRVAVMANPQAIGYVSLPVARMGGLKALAVDGRRPDEPGYPLVRPVSFVTLGPPQGEAAAFLRFVASPAGRELIREEGLVPAGDGP
jgi:phosphate transport system substrate-binding protein